MKKNERRTLYCSSIDFKKYFDYVYISWIWLEEGVSSKVVKILQSKYLSVKSCKRLFVGLVDSHMGVKQGEHLSPL